MACAMVSCRVWLTQEPVEVGVLVANCSGKTQISRRLAKKLGLTYTQDIFVRSSPPLKWKISLLPLIIISPALRTPCVVYPLINGQPDDAYYEMIVGQDCKEGLFELLRDAMNSLRESRCGEVTPGPSYSKEKVYMGHNIDICPSKELPPTLDCYLEYPCWGSDAVTKLALNKATKQLAVVYLNPSQVYIYSNLPDSVNSMVENDPSRGSMMHTIKNQQGVTFEIVTKFPRAVVANFDC